MVQQTPSSYQQLISKHKSLKKFWWFYFRAYPSLKLRINVNAARNEVDVVMPGLRYDDIDFTGNVCGQQEKLHIAIYKIHSIKQFENE